MATLKADNGYRLRTGNALKGFGLLLIILAVGTALLLAPALRKPPTAESFVSLPSMSNPPPIGSLQFEAPPPAP